MAHESVLQQEAVDALVTTPAGRYVDATFGRGGHSRAILDQLDDTGRLLVLDRDPEAIRVARELAEADPRVSVQRGDFGSLAGLLNEAGWSWVDGVLFDLGVSSPQLDEPERGFSFRHDGPLDMRMDPDAGQSAADWLAREDEKEIARVLRDYGEERFAKRIARRIVEARQEQPVTRTTQLAELIREAVPFEDRYKHPATRSFQAIRIRVNEELPQLDEALCQAVDHLGTGGRLVVISFHSLEDRRVKRFMRDRSRGPQLPRGVPVTAEMEETGFRTVGRAVQASEAERSVNVRARSAVMRVLERSSAGEA
ncbi:16S rRNA (cytosine(1402)-N(4))-methyltransferase RsmH [Halospina sp. K52047b]|uniref:16S rRNA (cytosine(1402)-N(4))-methyltransferase RsmH n=1 Tax=Halospina sp. K52047b TaxID=2614160 RepID=UPI001249E2A4|nr:16S rRNA (cytosine(1402)-N(4))-methyltransferase RsmH [Halospina sp. K52047b]KAA8980675.1 16S rRNA (cytosine(1402)-N(4))-methyltransferase RsmH [Halospina sp. K52047b]